MDPTSLIGFGGSLINYFGQLGQQNRAFEKNKQLAAYQNKLNIEQWNRENAYNTPMAMMARYKQAGMNPNLAYGLQNLSANSPELVGGTPVQQTNANIVDAQSVAQLGLLKAQKENIEADTQDKLSGVELNNAEISLKLAQGRLTDAEIDQIAHQNNLTDQEIVNLKSENERIQANTAYIQQQTAESVQRIENLKAEKSLTDEQVAIAVIDKLNKQKWYDATIDEIQSRANCNRAQAQLALEQATLAGLQGNYQTYVNERFDATWHNEQVKTMYEVQFIASNIVRNNVSNMRTLYGEAAGALHNVQGYTEAVSPNPGDKGQKTIYTSVKHN